MSERRGILDAPDLPPQPAGASTAANVPLPAATPGGRPRADHDHDHIGSPCGRRQFFKIPDDWSIPIQEYIFCRLDFLLMAFPFINSTDHEDC